jgi:hypothetical protein
LSYREGVRRLWLIPVLLGIAPCAAWDTVPHQRITKAALDSLAKRLLDRFGAEAAPLVEIYCTYPDRYLEMERYGFVRKSAGPRSPSEIRVYCVRPDGQPIHGASGDRATDLGSLVYLFERILSSFSEKRADQAARYAGVLSHFIADTLSPPHAVSEEELPGELHSAIERSLPAFTLGGRASLAQSVSIPLAAEAILERCYSEAAQNRRDLPAMVKAVSTREEHTLDVYRLRAGVAAAQILADALHTLAGQ